MGKKKTKKRDQTILDIPHNPKNALMPYQSQVPARPASAQLPAEMRVLGELLQDSPLTGLQHLEAVLHRRTDEFYEGRPLGGVRKKISKVEQSNQVRKQFKEKNNKLIASFDEVTDAQIDASRDAMLEDIEAPRYQRRVMREREDLLWHSQHAINHNPQIVSQREQNAHELRMEEKRADAESARQIRIERERIEAEYRRRPDVKIRERLQAILDAEEMMKEIDQHPDEGTRRRLRRMAQVATQQAMEGESAS